MALHIVDSAGLHKAACKNAMRCAIVAIGGQWRARYAMGCAVRVDEDEGCDCEDGLARIVAVWFVFLSTIHRPVAAVRVPLRTTRPRSSTMMLVASKCAVYHSSHSVPTDTKDAPGKSGNMCAFLAKGGMSAGRRSSHVWVDVAMRPSGILTDIGVSVGFLFLCRVAKDI